mmetsp:Transcript_26208/g.23194  ORF Transcript_26208/g.23194 Transcript_26208/m.23194 type:complete len:83 (+) Transcript_26208:107-355(+)
MSFGIFILTERFGNMRIIAIGILFTGLSQLLNGPIKFLPNSLIIMGIGQFLFGGFTVFFSIPLLPVLIQEGANKYPFKKFEV